MSLLLKLSAAIKYDRARYISPGHDPLFYTEGIDGDIPNIRILPLHFPIATRGNSSEGSRKLLKEIVCVFLTLKGVDDANVTWARY